MECIITERRRLPSVTESWSLAQRSMTEVNVSTVPDDAQRTSEFSSGSRTTLEPIKIQDYRKRKVCLPRRGLSDAILTLFLMPDMDILKPV